MVDKKRTWADVKSKTFQKTANVSGAASFFTRPIEYRPEFASPDRWWIPKDRAVLNGYWRMFYATDPVAGSVIDMYVEMPLSEYTISGKGVDGSILEDLTQMCEDVRLIQLLTTIMREFLVIGEAIPHLFFDPTVGYWTDWTIHKPEMVDVLDAHMLGIDPILVLQPSTEEIGELKKIIKMAVSLDIDMVGIPFLQQLVSKKKVPLESLNVTYIPRALHAYDVRGTSLFTRLWRTWMYEDAVANATIQTAKRHAAPVKTVQIGDINAGFVPSAEQEDELLKALAQAEMDPHAWLLVPPTTKFEAWGTTDRLMGFRTEYDVIERLKLMALGTSKDFISGASTFAAAQTGLQVFLSRLLSFRNFVEENFVYPKLFGVIVKANNWELPRQADVDHNVRTSKGREIIKPKIKWAKSLRPKVDKDLLDAYRMIVNDFGVRISQKTICEAAGVQWQDELRRSLEEESVINVMQDREERKKNKGDKFGGDFMGEEIGVEEVIPEPEMVEGRPIPMHASSLKKPLEKVDAFLSGVANVKTPSKLFTADDLVGIGGNRGDNNSGKSLYKNRKNR